MKFPAKIRVNVTAIVRRHMIANSAKSEVENSISGG